MHRFVAQLLIAGEGVVGLGEEEAAEEDCPPGVGDIVDGVVHLEIGGRDAELGSTVLDPGPLAIRYGGLCAYASHI